MKNKVILFLRSDKGDGIITFPFIIFISMILFAVSISIFEYTSIKGNLKTAANETLQIVKVENGADNNTKVMFNGLLTKMGLDSSKVTFYATPKGGVQRGDQVEVKASREYNVFALKAIGVDYSVTIEVQATGLAHKFIREGG